MRRCGSCGEELPDKFRICGFCGAPLPDPMPAPSVRKTVTVVFSDLAGSTQLGERLDSETLRAVMDEYFATLRRAIEHHGGLVEKFIGDAVMAVFGMPVMHEDDALRAVRAAVAMSAELAALNPRLERRFGVRLTARTGVNTGEVVAGDPAAGQRLVTGDTVNVAARLESAAPPGGILLGLLTHRLVRRFVRVEPMEPLQLKGKSAPVAAVRLVELVPTGAERRPGAFVGRAAELAALDTALIEAVAGGSCRARFVLGSVGTGKSRLVEEFVRTTGATPGTVRVLRGRCLSYGGGLTFWPLGEVVKAAAGISETDPPQSGSHRLAELTAGAGGKPVHERVAAAVGLSAEVFPLEELFWGARKLLEQLAADRPLVIVFEDLHWAEPSFLALLKHITESADAPIVLLGTARPEVLDRDPELGTGSLRADRLWLVPLEPVHLDQVLTGVTGDGAELPEAVRAAILDAAAGNPLFAEQMLSMLIDEGRLVRGEGGWVLTGDVAAVEAPPTIQALLDARLDQLPADDREVLEPASVVGTRFEVDAVRVLAAERHRLVIETRLVGLARKQLVAPIAAGADAPSYAFEHALVRDAAYARLLKRVRADLHERLVDWAEAEYTLRGRGDELDEILGYHLEQAHRYLRDTGRLDEHGVALGERAAARLAAAGMRAFAREDMPAAADLLRRTVDCREPDDPRRLVHLLPLAEAAMDLGELEQAQAWLAEALTHADARGDRGAAGLVRLLRLHADAQHGDSPDATARLAREAQGVIGLLEADGDDARLATAWRLLAWAHGTAGQFGAAAQAADAVVGYAALAGDDRQRRRASAQYAVAALYGPTPVPEAIERCRTILDRAEGDRRTQGLVGSVLARLVAMDGDPDRARGLYREAQRVLTEAGRGVVAASTSLDSCGVEVLAGDLPAAERELRRDYDALAAMGEIYLRSTVAGELARVLAGQGRDAEAWEFSRDAESLAAPDDIASQALWRLGRARLLARAGHVGEGCGLAEEAVRLLRATDACVTQAEALTDLAAVRTDAGRYVQARDAVAEALTLHRAKGNRVAEAATRVLEAELDDAVGGQRM